MAAQTAPEIGMIRAKVLCEAAAAQSRYTSEQVRLALGAISNMYCLYALDRNMKDSVTVIRRFTSDTMATRAAVIAEITWAVPGLDREGASSLLDRLASALDEIYAARNRDAVRLEGFGILRAVESGYELRLELPLHDCVWATA